MIMAIAHRVLNGRIPEIYDWTCIPKSMAADPA
jgi:hypothetical protein